MQPTKKSFLRDLECRAANIPSFTQNDRSSFLDVVDRLLQTDVLQVASALPKDEIRDTIKSALQEAALPEKTLHKKPSRALELCKQGFNKSRLRFFSIPLWEMLWLHIWNYKTDPFFLELDARVFHGVYNQARAALSDHALKKIQNEAQQDAPFYARIRELADAAIFPNLLLHIRGVRKKRGIRAIEHLLTLSEKGYGILYYEFKNYSTTKYPKSDRITIESRLPAYNEEQYPEITGFGGAFPLEIMVLQDATYVPEKIWHGPSLSDIINEENADYRRIMMKTIGKNDDFLSDEHYAHRIEEKDGITLYVAYLTSPNNYLAVGILRCQHPVTGKITYAYVPPTFRSVRDAYAWAQTDEGASYNPFKNVMTMRSWER